MFKKRLTLLGGAVSGLLILTSCGGTATESGADEEGLTKVTIGVVPVAATVGVQYGIENGIFEEHGIELETSVTDGGAAMVPAVHTGELDFGIGNPNTIMNAVDQGLDMKLVMGYAYTNKPGDPDIAHVIVPKDSGIEEWSDLEGRTVSVNAVRTQGDLHIMAAVERSGADPSTLNFSEIPFPDMLAQLERGNTDAIWVPEPFATIALASGENQPLGSLIQDTFTMPTMGVFSSDSFLEENPELVENFQNAMTESLAAAREDEQGVRDLIPEVIDMDPEFAQEIAMEDFDGELRRDVYDNLGELMYRYDFIDSEPDPSKIYYEPGS